MDFKRGSLVVKSIKASYTVEYNGPGISNNLFYAGGAGKNGWRVRSGIKSKYTKIFSKLLMESEIPWMDEYSLIIFFNSRMDSDNVSASAKVFLDTLKQERLKGKIIKKGWVYDDSSDYCKMVSMIPDKSLKPNTYQFVLLHL